MKTKVVLISLEAFGPDSYDADEVTTRGDSIQLFKKGKSVAILDNSQKRIKAAFVVKERKPRWRVKLVKE